MGNRRRLVILGVLAASLLWSRPTLSQPPKTAALLQDSLRTSIKQGASLFDKNDHAGCYSFCQGALVSLRPFLADNPKVLKDIDDSLRNAEKLSDMSERAQALRAVLDRVLLASLAYPPPRVVAYIYNDTAITREELGEYLIARMGAERVEALVDRRLIDKACKDAGITVTDAEVEAAFADDLKSLGVLITEKDFVETILKRFNKTLFEWKEDIIRPRLAMNKLAKQTVKVDEEDIHRAFAAKYGPKVNCRMIVLSATADSARVYQEVKDSEEVFARLAASDIQLIDKVRETSGKVPPIHKHFGDDKLEKAAFALKAGEVAPPIEMPDGTFVIMKCDGHIEADFSVKLETVRAALEQEVLQAKISKKIPELMSQLRQDAAPVILLKKR